MTETELRDAMGDLKTCRACGRELPLSAYYPQAGGRPGLRGSCKSCLYLVSQENKERYRASSAFPWHLVDKVTNDCWVWLGSRTPKGHGHYAGTSAQRLVWQSVNGPIPAGMWVLHHCDNPPCVNPEHLYLGTHADNVRDAVVRQRVRRGGAHPVAKLNEITAAEAKFRLRLGDRAPAIALDLGVHPQTIYSIKYGKSWRR